MMLDLYAGESAKKRIQQQGMDANIFSAFLGASGGPKWFCLFELDKYIFGEFLSQKASEFHLVGSSVGAFRAACFAQQDPVAAITRLADFYSQSCFSQQVSPQEVTIKAKEMVDHILADNGLNEIISNPVFKTHFLINSAKGLVGSENKVLQALGLIKSFALNRIDRKLIKNQYQRYVVRPSSSRLKIDDYCGFDTHYIDLTKHNLKDALLASGSIPIVMEGVKHIEGMPKGTYRDGGIIDYHFDIQLQRSSGLTLYPHFNANPKAGWFDKKLNRNVHKENYDNVLMIVPSAAFIDKLPYKKIPDRTDFDQLKDKERIAYWKTVLVETTRLADEFAEFCIKPDVKKIKSI